MEKPKFLYHGSANKYIETFEPRKESVRDHEEGPVIFTTPHKDYAATFVVNSDDSWTIRGTFGDEVFHIIIGDKKRFKRVDKGGSIYVLPPDTFECDLERNMKDKEWTSKTTVKPVQKIDYDSGLKAMIENGVKVYFVDKNTFETINKASDHGFSILQSLQSELA